MSARARVRAPRREAGRASGAPRRPRASAVARSRAIGVDTGGTFTDFVAVARGRLVTLKLPSTPDAPERAVLEGLARLGAARGTRVRHGSTVATNTLLERRGARVTFLTTAGFEDALEIARQDRPRLYDLAPRRPAPLVPAARRLGVEERMGPDGRALARLTRAAAARAARRAARTRPEAVAVGLLHAYANPAHERALGRALARLGVPVTLSSDLCPEFREVERFATTVANAALAPRVARYVEALARGTPAAVEIVLSHGGTAPPARAAREPVRQLLSGPAAGLEAAWDAARDCGFTRALTLDVGGTSTDVAYVEGALPRRRAREIAGVPVLLPMLDVHTVGAGGGSRARADHGLLRVGPESAGADPGPAAYGRGGPATVADALVVLGRLPFASLGGGAIRLVPEASGRAMAELARDLGLDGAVTAAAGVVALADAHMEAALRRVSVESGHDPRGAALVAFGGAGGLHACALAGALGCAAVVFPRHAGVLSALGALAAPARRERARTVLAEARDAAALERAFRALEAQVRAEFERARRGRVRLSRRVEARYRGQSHEIPLEAGPGLVERFHREHARRFGFDDRSAVVEVVNAEVRGEAAGAPLPARLAPRAATGPAAVARVWHEGRLLDSRVWARAALGPRAEVRGPALVADQGATLWVAPGWRARVHASGALVVARAAGPGARAAARGAGRRRPRGGRP
jgi:N-methylhydantoinase A